VGAPKAARDKLPTHPTCAGVPPSDERSYNVPRRRRGDGVAGSRYAERAEVMPGRKSVSLLS